MLKELSTEFRVKFSCKECWNQVLLREKCSKQILLFLKNCTFRMNINVTKLLELIKSKENYAETQLSD